MHAGNGSPLRIATCEAESNRTFRRFLDSNGHGIGAIGIVKYTATQPGPATGAAVKRDMELARQILQQIEASADPRGLVNLDFPDRTKDEVSYHVKLLAQAGFIEAADASTRAALNWIPRSLTYDGHEFLDAIRNETIWGKVKEKATEQGGSLPFEVLKALAVKVAMTLVGLG